MVNVQTDTTDLPKRPLTRSGLLIFTHRLLLHISFQSLETHVLERFEIEETIPIETAVTTGKKTRWLHDQTSLF